MLERDPKPRLRGWFPLIGCLLAALTAGGSVETASPEALPSSVQGCKPGAPIRVLLEQAAPPRGSQVDLRFTIEPLLAMESLEWELELPADTFLAQGQRRGLARRAPGERTAGRVRLSMPADGAFREVRLVARGVFLGSDADGSVAREEVVGLGTLRWGRPEPAAVVLAPDGAQRALGAHILLPTRHQPGRRPGWQERGGGESAAGRAALGGGFTVSGVFEYEDKDWSYTGWTGTDPLLPVRRADVTVLDDVTSAVLGTGSTGADGSFSIPCTSAGVTDVVVRVNADTDLDAFQRIRVTDGSNAEYSAESPVFAGHDTTLDLDVGTTTVAKITSGSNEANPFNMLDMGVAAWQYITGPLVGAASGSSVRIWWPEPGGSFASGQNAHISSDDGYDDSVILHELGHVVQNMYSDSDNPGGSHAFGDSDQDPRLSFGEGYATFFMGAVQIAEIGVAAVYFDGSGSSQNGGIQLRLRLEGVAPYASDAFGAADEVAVAVTLYDILDDENSPDNAPGSDDEAFVSGTLVDGLGVHEAWWDVFSGPVGLASNLTLNDAWNGWFSEHGASGLHSELEDLYELRRIHFSNDADEPNDTSGSATPAVVDGQWSPSHTLYAGSGTPPSPGFGDEDWYQLELVIGSIVSLETRYPGGAGDADTQADTHLRLVAPGGAITESDGGGFGRNAALTSVPVTESGTWKVRVRTNHSYRRYGRYDYRFQYAFQNLVPSISAGPAASPAKIGPHRDDCTLSVSASDDQALITLTYEWTPLDGGTISGSGASVTFVPPNVQQDTTFHVELVLEDIHGARSQPVTVAIPVIPFARQVGPAVPVGP